MNKEQPPFRAFNPDKAASKEEPALLHWKTLRIKAAIDSLGYLDPYRAIGAKQYMMWSQVNRILSGPEDRIMPISFQEFSGHCWAIIAWQEEEKAK